MRFLLDANLSPRLAEALTELGCDVRHVMDVGLVGASDTQILLLASRRSVGPSVILMRQVAEQIWAVHLALLTGNLAAVKDDLEAGTVVSLSPTRLAVRRLGGWCRR